MPNTQQRAARRKPDANTGYGGAMVQGGASLASVDPGMGTMLALMGANELSGGRPVGTTGSPTDREARQDNSGGAAYATAQEAAAGDAGAVGRGGVGALTGGWGAWYIQNQGRKRFLKRQNQEQANAAEAAAAFKQANQLRGLDDGQMRLILQQQQANGGGALDPAQMAQLLGQYKLNQQRARTVQGIEAYFANPALRKQQEAYYRQAEQDAYAGLADDTRGATQQAAFRTADAGQQGSSMEIERTGRLARARDEAAARIGAQTQQAMQTAAGRDRQRRQQLLTMAYEDSPSVAQANARQMLGLQRQADFEQDAADTQGNYEKIRQQASDAYGQALGAGVRGMKPLAAYYGTRYGQREGA